MGLYSLLITHYLLLKLSITDNAEETATLIADTTNNNQLLAIINQVSAAYITVDDFISI